MDYSAMGLPASPSIKALQVYGTNLTDLAREGKLDPVIGHEEEIQRVIQILGKRRKNNPCLIGEPGVGKTAIAEGLALHLLHNKVSPKLKGAKVISIEIDRLFGSTKYANDFIKALSDIIDEVKQSKGKVILFVDEMHTLVQRGAENILKPALARGELKCLGATTFAEYKNYIEQDTALERRFQPIKVQEPSVNQTIQILQGLRSRYEMHHKVVLPHSALVSAAKLSKRYISDRFLPDKAIDLMDEAGSLVHLRQPYGQTPSVQDTDIQKLVSSWTGIPMENISRKDSEYLLEIESNFHKHIIGQEEAVHAISTAIHRSHVGVRDPNRPVSSFLFTGPTGVGKTEVANVLAKEYFGCKDAMVRLDMSEFYDKHTAARLVGSPPGYVGYHDGGQLTEAVRRKPHSLVLFDEIEKAHPDVFDMMLQIFEDGRLTDGSGRIIDFKNTILVMTSNLGSAHVIRKGEQVQNINAKKKVMEELRKVFRPEFINRVDEVIVFHELTKKEVSKIVDLMVNQVSQRLKENQINLEVSKRFKDRVFQEGYNPTYGARPLRRTLVRLLENTLAQEMLSRGITREASIVVDIDSGGEVSVSIESIPSTDKAEEPQEEAQHQKLQEGTQHPSRKRKAKKLQEGTQHPSKKGKAKELQEGTQHPTRKCKAKELQQGTHHPSKKQMAKELQQGTTHKNKHVYFD